MLLRRAVRNMASRDAVKPFEPRSHRSCSHRESPADYQLRFILNLAGQRAHWTFTDNAFSLIGDKGRDFQILNIHDAFRLQRRAAGRKQFHSIRDMQETAEE